MHILPNTSKRNGNQTIKLGQLKERNKSNVFLKNFTENKAGRLAPNLFLFFKKT